jgi:hypothetical protein
MDDKKLTTIIDPTLTPQNAQAKGYEYIDDVIYDNQASAGAMKEVLELVSDFNGKLGESTHGKCLDPYFGLYIPKEIKKLSKEDDIA